MFNGDVLQMEVKEIKKPNCIMELEFDVPFEELKNEYKTLYKQTVNSVPVPGFRKGKAPESMVRSKALGYVIEEFKKNQSGRIFYEYIKEKKISLYNLTEPKIKKLEFDENQPLKFSVEFEINPEISFDKNVYENLTIPKVDYTISDSDVEEEIKAQIKNNRLMQVEETEAEIQEGYEVFYNVSGKDTDGNIISELCIEDYNVLAKKSENSENLPETIVNKLIGKKKGDIINFDYTFGENAQTPSLSGKKVDIEVTIKKVEIEKSPEFDDELAKKLGGESASQLREKMSEDMKKAKKQESEQSAIDTFYDQIAGTLNIELPETMINYMNYSEQADAEKYFEQYRIKREQYYALIQSTPEAWLEKNRPKVIAKINRFFVEEKMLQLEGIEVSDEDMDIKLEEYAKVLGKEKKEVKRDLIKKERWDNFKKNIQASKLHEFILEKFQK